MNRILIIVGLVVLAAAIVGVGLWQWGKALAPESPSGSPISDALPSSNVSTTTSSGISVGFMEKRFQECGSFPNGTTTVVVDTARIFVNLPADIYPSKELGVSGHGATAGNISNGGIPGDALDAQDRPNCSSWYLEFDLTDEDTSEGNIDISAKSASPGMPDYLVHFQVLSYERYYGGT